MVRSVLGHADFNSTLVYSHIQDQQAYEAIEDNGRRLMRVVGRGDNHGERDRIMQWIDEAPLDDLQRVSELIERLDMKKGLKAV